MTPRQWMAGEAATLRGEPMAVAVWQWEARLGGLDVVDTKDRRKTARLERQKRGAETRQRRRDD